MHRFEPSQPRRPTNAAVSADAVLLAWRRLIHERRPWRDMHADDLSGELRRVLVEVLDDPAGDDDARRSAMRRAARAHGAYRRRQACPAQAVVEEMEIVEQAIAEVLQRSNASREFVDAILNLLEPDMRSVTNAAHIGFLDRSSPSNAEG